MILCSTKESILLMFLFRLPLKRIPLKILCLGSSGCGELNWPFICSKKDPGCIADPKVVPNKRSGRNRVRDNEVELQMVHHTTACRASDQSSSPNLLPLE